MSLRNELIQIIETRGFDLLPRIVAVFILILVLRGLLTAAYDVLLHPLASFPGPKLGKIFNHYMTPALVGGHRAQTLYKLHKQYGPVIRIAPNELSISEWQAYRKIYSNKVSKKDEDFYSAVKITGLDNLFTMRNKAMHSARRKMQSQPYSQQAILENESLIASKSRIMVDRIIARAQNSSSGKTVDVYDLCGLFSLEVILQCAFNHDSGPNEDGDSLKLLQAMEGAAKAIPIATSLPFLKEYGLGRYLPGAPGDGFRDQDRWTTMTQHLITRFQQNEVSMDKTNKFMATPLLINKDEFLGRLLTPDEVLEEAMGIAFAGSGTTSMTLLYIIYRMSCPEAAKYQRMLYEELQQANEAGGGGHIKVNQAQDLPFLNAVIKETMRLHPTIISTLPRILEDNIPFALADGQSWVLPKGTKVGMQNYVHHRDPNLFPDPDAFLPERWLDDGSSQQLKDMNSAMTPFSLGPRNCIGQNLARAELLLCVSEMFIRLRFRLGEEMEPNDLEMEDQFAIAPRGRKLVVEAELM